MHSFVLLRISQQKSAASIVGHLKSEYASLAIILFLVFSFFFPVDKETSVRLIVAQMLCLRHFNLEPVHFSLGGQEVCLVHFAFVAKVILTLCGNISGKSGVFSGIWYGTSSLSEDICIDSHRPVGLLTAPSCWSVGRMNVLTSHTQAWECGKLSWPKECTGQAMGRSEITCLSHIIVWACPPCIRGPQPDNVVLSFQQPSLCGI